MIASYLLAALIVVHIAGSLRHHFVKRNDVMRRMWFGSTGGMKRASQHPGAVTPSAPAKSIGS
jgi:cytochrome b